MRDKIFEQYPVPKVCMQPTLPVFSSLPGRQQVLCSRLSADGHFCHSSGCGS